MMKPVIAIVLAAVILFGAAWCLKTVGQQNAQAYHVELMKTLLPGSESFTLEAYDGEDANIRSVHKAENGFVVETVTYGYAGEITMLIGVSNEGKVTGLVVKESHETPGLGNNILTDHVFLSQFLNGDGEFTIGTSGADAFSGATGESASADANEVDAITGATVSSKAVARCVSSAVAFVTGADVSSSATEWGG